MSIIACYSSKGGVGKTSTAVNIAYAASMDKKRKTLLIDLDQQGASTFYFRVRPPKQHRPRLMLSNKNKAFKAIRETDFKNLHILPANQTYRNFDALLDSMKRSKLRLADLIDEIGYGYETIILDCPPSLSLVAENIFRAADRILVPVVPTTLSKRTFEQLKDFFEKTGYKKKSLCPFFSMVDKRKRMHLETIKDMRKSEKRLLKTAIPFRAQVEAMGVHREPVINFAPKDQSSVAFLQLWKEIRK
ncbi:ParA family protein [Puniceicoccaceae bacterium K14]|nr:ParA family protein [Puniceicoccaceae bacterium K14]